MSNATSQPKFGSAKLVQRAALVVAGGGLLLLVPHIHWGSGSEALPQDKTITQPSDMSVTLDGQQPKQVTVKLVVEGITFLFTGNPVTDPKGNVDEDHLKACVREVLAGDNTMRSDVFQFHPDKDVVLCELNSDDTAALTSWGIVSGQSVTDRSLHKS